MKKNRLAAQILVMAFAVSCLGVAWAAGSIVTVFPEAMVKVTQANGKVIRMTANFPLQPGAVMEASGGPVIVRGPNFRFTAQTNTKFSLNEAGGNWVLTIYSGRVDYALNSNAKVKFAHGNAVYDCQKITPAKVGGNVQGSASVAGDKLAFANSAGELTVVDPVVGGHVITPTEVAVGAAVVGGATAGVALGLSSGNSSESSH